MAPKKQPETKPMTEKPITVPKAEPVERRNIDLLDKIILTKLDVN